MWYTLGMPITVTVPLDLCRETYPSLFVPQSWLLPRSIQLKRQALHARMVAALENAWIGWTSQQSADSRVTTSSSLPMGLAFDCRL